MMLLSAKTLVFGFLSILGGSSWESVATIMIICAAVLIYCLPPSTRRAFGVPT